MPGHVPEVVQRIGDVLRTFLAGAGWSYHERAILAAARDGTPIFLTIRSAAAELYALPWEFVALKATGQLLGSIPELLIRYEWPDAPTFPDRVDPAHRRGRVLVAWSAAGGAIPADKLVTVFRDAFKDRPGGFDIARDVIPRATVGRIARALDDAAEAGPPIDALHILCHGTEIGGTYGLTLDDEFDPGRAVPVDASRLQQLLAPHAGMVRMVVLAACDSGNVGRPGNHLGSVAQMIHRAGVQAVVASRYPLSTGGAVSFASAFYGALVGEAVSAEQAFLAGRDLLLRDPSEFDWASIQLYARHGDGHASAPLGLAGPAAGARVAPPPERPPPPPVLHRTTLPTPPRAHRRFPPVVLLGVLCFGPILVALVIWQIFAEEPPVPVIEAGPAADLGVPPTPGPATNQPTPVVGVRPPEPKPPDPPPSTPADVVPTSAPETAEILAERKRDVSTKLKALGQRESKDRSERCDIVNDFKYSKLTLSLAVDVQGRVQATSVQTSRLNSVQSECLRRAIEAEVFTSPGQPFILGRVTLTVD